MQFYFFSILDLVDFLTGYMEEEGHLNGEATAICSHRTSTPPTPSVGDDVDEPLANQSLVRILSTPMGLACCLDDVKSKTAWVSRQCRVGGGDLQYLKLIPYLSCISARHRNASSPFMHPQPCPHNSHPSPSPSRSKTLLPCRLPSRRRYNQLGYRFVEPQYLPPPPSRHARQRDPRHPLYRLAPLGGGREIADRDPV